MPGAEKQTQLPLPMVPSALGEPYHSKGFRQASSGLASCLPEGLTNLKTQNHKTAKVGKDH